VIDGPTFFGVTEDDLQERFLLDHDRLLSLVHSSDRATSVCFADGPHAPTDRGTLGILMRAARVVRPSPDTNFTVQLLTALRARAATIVTDCAACDRPLLHTRLSVASRPTLCGEPTCAAQCVSHGAGVDALADLRVNGEAAALAFRMLVHTMRALHGAQFPYVPRTVTDADLDFFVGFSPALKEMLRSLGVASETALLERLCTDDLETELSRESTLREAIMAVMQWRLAHAAYALRPLQSQSRACLVEAASPRREAAFELTRAFYGGSFFAFTGSPFWRWHSILMFGLKVLSGSPHQLHGASLGSGVYLSPSLAMALRHATNGGRMQTASRRAPCVVALCEVVHAASLITSTVPAAAGGPRAVFGRAGMYVVHDASLITIRAILVGDDDGEMPFEANGDVDATCLYHTLVHAQQGS